MITLLGTRDKNGRGYFVELPIGSPAKKQVTLIFVPAGYQPSSQVDLIAFHHGFTSLGDIRDYFVDRAREGIWSGIEQATKNVVFAAASLGPNPEMPSRLSLVTSQGKNLGFPDWVDGILQGMAEFGPQATGGGTPMTSSLPPMQTPANQPPAAAPSLRNLILAGHSAGGKPLLEIAKLSHRYSGNVKECWCFDGFYYGSTPWIDWARANPTKQLIGYYTAGKSADFAKAIDGAGLANVTMTADLGSHDSEPSRLLGRLVDGSRNLS